MYQSSDQAVLVLANCLHGAMRASRFVVRNLYNPATKILLQQSFEGPDLGSDIKRDISPMLQNIANGELIYLKNSILKEFHLPSDSVEKSTYVGELPDLLTLREKEYKNLSIVVGVDTDVSFASFPCLSVIKTVINSGISPVYIISDSIVLITRKNIILFTHDQASIPETYHNYLNSIEKKNELQIITLSKENPGNRTQNSFSTSDKHPAEPKATTEREVEMIFRSRIEHIKTD